MALVRKLKDIARKLAPGFLSDERGQQVVYCLHVFADAVQELVFQGIQGRFPLMCDESCLNAIGRDRGITRGPNEPAYSFRRRLLWWLSGWRIAGHAYPLLDMVAGYLLPSKLVVRLVTNSGGYYTREADGAKTFVQASPNNWDWDGQTSDWWRFWLIIYDPLETTFPKEGKWGSAGKWGDKGKWGSDMSPVDTAEGVRKVVGEWMAEHNECWWMIVSYGDPATDFTPTSAETDGDWQYWGVLSAGTMVANRVANARYADGTEPIEVIG